MSLKLITTIILLSVMANIVVFLFGYYIADTFMMLLATLNILLLSTFFMNSANFKRNKDDAEME